MKERQSARIILLNRAREVLLFEVNDEHSPNPMVSKTGAFWIVPGGGIEPGETAAQAAHRELREETGMTGLTLSDQIATFELTVTFADGQTMHVTNHVFVAESGDQEASSAGIDAVELSEIANSRWWSIEELRDEQPDVQPPALVEVIERVVNVDIQAQ